MRSWDSYRGCYPLRCSDELTVTILFLHSARWLYHGRRRFQVELYRWVVSKEQCHPQNHLRHGRSRLSFFPSVAIALVAGWTSAAVDFAGLLASEGTSDEPLTLFVGETLDRNDAVVPAWARVRLLAARGQESIEVEAALAVSTWFDLGEVRAARPNLLHLDPEARLIRSDRDRDEAALPQLSLIDGRQLIAFATAERSGLAILGPDGAQILVEGEPERFVPTGRGVQLSTNGERVAWLISGADSRPEIVTVLLASRLPLVSISALSSSMVSFVDGSLALTDTSVYATTADASGAFFVARYSADSDGRMAVTGEIVAGPFVDVEPYPAVGRDVLAMIAATAPDSRDVYIVRDRESAAVNVTNSPAQYSANRADLQRLAVSDAGEFVAYSIRSGGSNELFLHALDPGTSTIERFHVTADERFNPYIDQEIWVFFGADDRLYFAGGHDLGSLDVYALDPRHPFPVNLTQSTGNDLPPFLKGSLAISDMLVDDSSVLVAASGFGGAGTGVVGIEVETGATFFEAFEGQAASLSTVGATAFFEVVAIDGVRSLYALTAGEAPVLISRSTNPARVIATTLERIYFAVPGVGLIAFGPRARSVRLHENGEVFPAGALTADGRYLFFGAAVPDAGASQYFLLDVQTGGVVPFASHAAPAQIVGVAGCLPPQAKEFLRGDANRDDVVDVSDAILALNFLFVENTNLVSCLDAADANDSGGVDISDPIAVLGFLFVGNGALPHPYPEPGEDPTPDELGCLLRP